MSLSRRQLMLGTASAIGSITISSVSRVRSQVHYRQFHNQPADSTLHRSLIALWSSVKRESNDKFIVETFALNHKIPGSDPQALDMLLSGNLEFFTIMGGILGNVVPVAEIQGLPFVFSNSQQVFAAFDGVLGNYLQKEIADKGIYAFSRGCFDNGFRQISNRTQPIQTAQDMVGLKIRVPQSPIFIDFFQSLQAETHTFNALDIYDAIKSGKVDAEENPLTVIEGFKLYQVQKYISLTNHMWSGFNLISNLKFWNKIPTDIQDIIQRNVVKYVSYQRQQQRIFDQSLTKKLKHQGLYFNQVDVKSFHNELVPFYTSWREHFGLTAWNMLESYVGEIK